MRLRTILWTVAMTVSCFGFSGVALGQVLHQFSTADATLDPDDGYDPNVVNVIVGANVIAPANGAELEAGNVGLARLFNTEWAGFSLSSANGTTLDSADEFATGYLTWTVAADPGLVLNLNSLDFDSARGGGDPLTQTRRFELYASVNGGAFTFGDTPIRAIDNETGTRAEPEDRSVDLSGAEFQGIDSVTFRYYPLTPATGNTMDFGTMTLNGVVVPEPSALALGGLVLLPLLGRRARR